MTGIHNKFLSHFFHICRKMLHNMGWKSEYIFSKQSSHLWFYQVSEENKQQGCEITKKYGENLSSHYYETDIRTTQMQRTNSSEQGCRRKLTPLRKSANFITQDIHWNLMNTLMLILLPRIFTETWKNTLMLIENGSNGHATSSSELWPCCVYNPLVCALLFKNGKK